MPRAANNIVARRETVTGVLVAANWDQEYKVTGVVIACEGERDIHVINSQALPELAFLMGKRVSATGAVFRKSGVESMRVRHCYPLD